jgi:hypothetical protein
VSTISPDSDKLPRSGAWVRCAGWVTRQIELEGRSGRPVTAASLSEWFEELEAGRIQLYQAKFGGLADKPISRDELDEYEPVVRDDFEELWQRARLHLSDQAER